MKVQYVRCPRCASTFYEKVEGRDRLDLSCPYCHVLFSVQHYPPWTKEVDYNWEIYSDLYAPVKERGGSEKMVKISGVLLAITVPFIVLPFLYLLVPGFFGNLVDWERSFILGTMLATTVFLSFVLLGIYNSLKTKSFALALSGTIFSLLSVALSGSLSTMTAFQGTLLRGLCFLMFVPLALSLVSMLLCIKSRKYYNVGY